MATYPNTFFPHLEPGPPFIYSPPSGRENRPLIGRAVQTIYYNAKLHWLALFIAAVTFPLIFLGSLVTSYHAGMSVPDWPNSWGYNMFTFPPSKWIGGIRFEHTHRLAASFVGMLSIALVIVAWKTDDRKWIRFNALAVFLAVCLQGVLGGMRVVLNALDLAMIHGCVAQLFFCYIATFCVLTSRTWNIGGYSPHYPYKKAFALASLTVIFVLAQLIVGVIMRHQQAGLAIPDFPTSYGHLLPPTTIDNSFRAQAIHQFGPNLNLNRVTLFQIWIHFTHRVGAIFVTCAILTLCFFYLKNFRHEPTLFRLACALLIFLPTQITLGICTILYRKPVDVASLHVAIGSLILVTSWVAVVRSFSLWRWAQRVTPAGKIPSADFRTVAMSN
jgi:heme a synthase